VSAPPLLLALLAAAPILVILVAMLGPKWPAVRAAALGVGVALVLLALPLPFSVPRAAGAPLPDVGMFVVGIGAEASFLTLGILWILWPALALHAYQQQRGALRTLERGLLRVTPHRPAQLLLVFFEGAAGFGAPIAMCAPILVSLGVPLRRARHAAHGAGRGPRGHRPRRCRHARGSAGS